MFKIIKKIKNINFKPKKVYEFKIFEGNVIMAERDLKILQENGWELAGEISTKFGDNC